MREVKMSIELRWGMGFRTRIRGFTPEFVLCSGPSGSQIAHFIFASGIDRFFLTLPGDAKEAMT